jgi:aspartyl protease/uncharacterized protein DUF4124
MRRRLVAAVAGLALVVWTAPAGAQLYRWVNEQGEVHFTQGLEAIPERFRAGAKLLGYPEAVPPPPPTREAETRAAPTVRGGARIPFTPGSPIVVTVRVNGLRTLRLILDTGADTTLIHPLALSGIGVDPSRGRPVTVTGVTGAGDGHVVALESLEVGQARVGPMAIVAYDLIIREGDGLLGRDFLDQFKVTVDTEAQVVLLSPR